MSPTGSEPTSEVQRTARFLAAWKHRDRPFADLHLPVKRRIAAYPERSFVRPAAFCPLDRRCATQTGVFRFELPFVEASDQGFDSPDCPIKSEWFAERLVPGRFHSNYLLKRALSPGNRVDVLIFQHAQVGHL